MVEANSGLRDPDCWYGEQNPAERKRIQNRLAQRARRKRLAKTGTTPQHPSAVIERAASSVNDLNCLELVRVIPPPNPGGQLSNGVSLAVFEALHKNGKPLGLSCAACMPSKSSKPQSAVPAYLQPTALQMTTIHYLWIDLFPFPQMRDNMISLSGVLDAEDFLQDLFSMESFAIKPGCASWDPTGWTICKDFSMKWGYLFH